MTTRASTGACSEAAPYLDRLAVVTGAGSGMGRELVLQLAARGCSVAACDLDLPSLQVTVTLAAEAAMSNVSLSSHVCDVADREQVAGLPAAVLAAHHTDHVDLLFNNAGIHGDESFVGGDRERWERVFDVCWNAVYQPTRAFLPSMMASPSACLVNTSSLNGYWAKHADGAPCTAYSAAKFAVRGLSEALLEDFRTNAPSIRVATVFPGTVVTGLGANSARILAPEPTASTASPSGMREYLRGLGVPTMDLAQGDLDKVGALMVKVYMLPAADAVRQILDGVAAGRWRLLVGEDAVNVDMKVRAAPDDAYEHGGVNQVDVDLLRGLISLLIRADQQRTPAVEVTFGVLVGGYDLCCRAGINGVEIDRRRSAETVSATLRADSEAFRQVMTRVVPLDQALSEGRVRVDGDRKSLEGLVNALRPEPSAVQEVPA